MKTILTLCLLFKTVNVFAFVSYYPQSTLKKFNNPDLSANELREELYNLSAKIHVVVEGKNDTLAEVCPRNQKCLSQRLDLTYSEARKIMFGELFLQSKGNGKYLLKDVYCNKNFDQNQGVGPNSIPNSNVLNCEHTWPQSKFNPKYPAELQKTDLHHLFPSDMRANSTRNNHPFADVSGRPTNSTCTDSQIGTSLTAPEITAFEPPAEHKGNVARAIYYFSIRYKMPIAETEAEHLRVWNVQDPVDADEIERNDKIMDIQGNRNPFVDYPNLINLL
jgi:deoxyribonuclease-1